MAYATTADGVRLYYQVSGAGEPLLLIPGQGADHRFWMPVLPDLVGAFQVISFDPRGTGNSDKPLDPPYYTRGFAHDAVAILDHLGISRAHAYGISLGGRVCQWLGIEYAQRIGALVLGCTTPGNRHGVRRADRVDTLFHKLVLDSAAIHEMAALLCSPEWIKQHPEFLLQQEQALTKQDSAHVQRLHYQASEGHDAWDHLGAIQAPTLVIHGSDDHINETANAYLLARRIPGAQLRIVEGGRHLFFLEFREASSRVVLDFLRAHPINETDPA